MTSGKRNLIIAGVVALIVVFGLYSFLKGNYNTFVTLDEAVKGSWAQVENQLQRRYDLIPEPCRDGQRIRQAGKGCARGSYKRQGKGGWCGEVCRRRSAPIMNCPAPLSRLLVVVERYPDLKSNQNFLRLQDELAGTENRIAVERKRYNDAVKTYNIAIRSFPANLLAGMFNFQQRNLFRGARIGKGHSAGQILIRLSSMIKE